MGRLASYHPTDLRLRKVLRDGRAGPGRCCYPRPPQRVRRRCKRERAERPSGSFAIDLARVSRAAGQSGGCGGGYGANVVVSSTTRASRADLRAASMISDVPGPSDAGLETSRRCSTREARPASTIARGGERGSLGCRARRVQRLGATARNGWGRGPVRTSTTTSATSSPVRDGPQSNPLWAEVCSDCGEPYDQPGLVSRCKNRHQQVSH